MTHPALVRIASMHHRLMVQDDYADLMSDAENTGKVAEFAAELRSLDFALTGKTHPDQSYMTNARKIMEGEVVTLHLADGGYSRLSVGITESPRPWMDRGLSLPRAVARWDAMIGRK